jgi:hypothetical protein
MVVDGGGWDALQVRVGRRDAIETTRELRKYGGDLGLYPTQAVVEMRSARVEDDQLITRGQLVQGIGESGSGLAQRP